MDGASVLFSRLQKKTQKLRRMEHERARRRIRSIRQEFYADLWNETARRLQFEYQRIAPNKHRISNNTSSIEITGGQVPLDDASTAERIGNKSHMYAVYRDIGISVPPYKVFSKRADHIAAEFMNASATACVLKPARDTGGGQGVTMGIDTPTKLSRAIRHSATYCDELIIESEVEGAAYRLLYLDGELLDIVRRNPPCILGDGKRSIRELVREENSLRRKASPISALSLLTIDDDMVNTLDRAGLQVGAVPRLDESIQVKGACNQNAKRENQHSRSTLHPQTEMQIQTIIDHFEVRLAGIDLVCKDISAPMDPKNGYIFEVNTYPGLHHHFLAIRDQKPNFITDKVVSLLMSNHA